MKSRRQKAAVLPDDEVAAFAAIAAQAMRLETLASQVRAKNPLLRQYAVAMRAQARALLETSRLANAALSGESPVAEGG
jgi:hypothetical protein